MMKHLHQIWALIISHALPSPPTTTRSLCTAVAAAVSDSTTPSFSLENVTKSNFESSLPDLLRHIRAADFIAVDLEMTGVTSAPWRESFEFDRRTSTTSRSRIQPRSSPLFSSAFAPFAGFLIEHPYNFYIFPRQELPAHGPACEFSCQTTSLDFLARYQCLHT